MTDLQRQTALLELIRDAVDKHGAFRPGDQMAAPWKAALRALEDRGQIAYKRSARGYVVTQARGSAVGGAEHQ